MSIGALLGIALAVGIGVLGGGALLVLFGWWLWNWRQNRRARAVLPESPDEYLDDDPGEELEDERYGRHHLRPDDTVRLDPVTPVPLANPVRPYMRRRQP